MEIPCINKVILSYLLSYLILFNSPINVKPAGGRRGIGRDFDIFQKNAVKFPTPGQKCDVKITEISHHGK